MFIVGLTGGIASGKTVVSDGFELLGVPIIDTDIIAREIVEPDSVGLKAIVEGFGADIVSADNCLDRKKLRNIIFSNKEKRELLESITHPLIWARSQELIDSCSARYCILVVPLLTESKMDKLIDRILVVDVPKEIQMERLLNRDGETLKQAEAIIASQISREKRLSVADDVIINDQEINKLQKQIEILHNRYIDLSKKKEFFSV